MQCLHVAVHRCTVRCCSRPLQPRGTAGVTEPAGQHRFGTQSQTMRQTLLRGRLISCSKAHALWSSPSGAGLLPIVQNAMSLSRVQACQPYQGAFAVQDTCHTAHVQ